MKKTLKGVLLMSVLILVAISGVSDAKEKVMNIALWKLPLNLPAMAAREDGTYERAFAGKVKVNHVSLPSGPRQIQAIGAGQLDIGEGLGAPAVLVGATAGVDLKIIGVCSRSPRGFAIVVNDPKIKTAADLKGKRIAGVKGSVVHQLYTELMHEAGLSEKEVEFYPTTLPSATAALLAGRVDAALLAGTEIIRAQKGGARVLADGEGRLDGLSLIVVRTRFLEDNPSLIKQYMKLRRDIVATIKINPERFIKMTAKEIGISEQEAKDLMSWYNFDDRMTSADIIELNKTLSYLRNNQMIRDEIDITRMIY